MEWVYLFFAIALLVSAVSAIGILIYENYKKRKSQNSNRKDR